ncbi:unnamed protein product [Calypogeia fissa]
MDAGQSSDVHPIAAEDEGETVEIRIKTLDAQSYTLRVDKNTSVPALKDQIASVVGVPVENQRLICRGKVLKDDQLLGAYNVEDGHTLHLVARQPPQPSAPSSTSGQDQPTGPAGPSDMLMMSPRNRPGHVSHSLLMGTINIPDSGEGGIPDLNRIISAVLNSVGMGNAIPAGAGAGPGGSVAVGVLPPRTQAPGSDGQAQAEVADGRSQGVPPLGDQNDSIDDIEAQLQLDAIYGVPSPAMFGGTGGTVPSNAFRILQQPAVVPDALTTMSQYLDRLEQSFSIIGGRVHNVAGAAGGPAASESPIQVEGNAGSGQTPESLSGQTGGIAQGSSSGPSLPSTSNPTTSSGGQSSGAPGGPVATPRRLPTPSSLGTIVSRVQHLLSDQAGTALARLAAQLENEPNLVDATAREEMQRTALRDGNMMQQLGALLLELGRTTLTLRMGQSPAESVVNAGPAVFISPSGPNPMMVQSLPSQTGVALGALPSGTPQANGGIVGPSLGPRSINIHIHTSDLRLPSPSPSATPPPQQPPPRAVIGVTSGAPVLTVRNLIERADASNPEHALTVRQIIERAEAASGVQQGNADLNSQATAGGAVQGAIMTFNENGAMRVVPVRTRTAAVPIATSSHTGNEGDAMFQPLVARLQQQLGSAQHGRSGSTPPGSTTSAATNIAGSTSSGEHPPSSVSSPSVRAQVHIQAWAPSIIQALGGVHSQPGSSQVSSGAPVGETVPPSTNGHGPIGGATGSQRDSSVPVANDRATDGVGSGQLQEGLVEGVDVAQIVDSLGPFLNQLAMAFQHARPQTAHQSPSQQLNEQPLASQPNVEGTTVNLPAVTASPNNAPESNGLSALDESGPGESSVEQSNPGADLKSEDNMDVGEKTENVEVSQDTPGSSSTSTSLVDEPPLDGKRPHEGERQLGVGDQAVAPPVGLGLGGLQPLPARSRRRGQSPRQVQMADTGAAAAAGNGLPAASGREQTLTPVAAQNLSPLGRPSNRSEGNAMEQLPSQLTQGLLPLLGSLDNRGIPQGGEGHRELGDFMGQLISRTADGSGGQGEFPADMLRGMMGQLVQSPLMENLVQQVMTGVQNDEAQNPENSLPGHGNRSQGVPGAFDFAGIVQQMLPVVSQMFGGRPSSNAAQQVPSSTNIRNHNDGGAERDSPGPINDSGRWREALSEEEIASWSETISADVEQQQSMEPQRPFSDVYVRGSPLAKRQKTELEGNAQKLENGASHEEVLRSGPESASAQVGGSNGSTNGAGISQLAQQTAVADGMANTRILAMIPGSRLQPESSYSRRRPRSQLEDDDDWLQ